jgi:hypothetical protein
MRLGYLLNPTERIRVFCDRKEAGRLLADALSSLKDRKDVIVLAIPRGGVVVAKEVASKIHAPLDVIITRKIGAPMNPELAVGAVDDEGEAILDHDLVNMLGISPDYLRQEYERQTQEIRERAKKYRRNRPPPVLLPVPSTSGLLYLQLEQTSPHSSSRATTIPSALPAMEPGPVLLLAPA